MIIRLNDLSAMAKRFLITLDRNGIGDLEAMEKFMGMKFPISDDEREFVQISANPSNKHTMAYTISYVVDGAGVPMEAKINPMLEYTKIIVKSESDVPGYFAFSRDNFGNLQQMKDLHPANMEIVRRELTSLVSLSS